jgi:hypothetical protein
MGRAKSDNFKIRTEASLALRANDRAENCSASQHFIAKIGGTLFPVAHLARAVAMFFELAFKAIVGGQASRATSNLIARLLTAIA